MGTRNPVARGGTSSPGQQQHVGEGEVWAGGQIRSIFGLCPTYQMLAKIGFPIFWLTLDQLFIFVKKSMRDGGTPIVNQNFSIKPNIDQNTIGI
jgi:hypothetical protein